MNPDHLALRDRWLDETVAGLLEHDDRLRGLDVKVAFDGGVAHVDGQVESEEDRERLREAVCGLRGAHAFWDGLVVGDRPPLRVVDVGSGPTRQREGSLVDPGGAVGLVTACRGTPVPSVHRHGGLARQGPG